MFIELKYAVERKNVLYYIFVQFSSVFWQIYYCGPVLQLWIMSGNRRKLQAGISRHFTPRPVFRLTLRLMWRCGSRNWNWVYFIFCQLSQSCCLFISRFWATRVTEYYSKCIERDVAKFMSKRNARSCWNWDL